MLIALNRSQRAISLQHVGSSTANYNKINYKLSTINSLPPAIPARIGHKSVLIWRRPLWSANLRTQRFRAPSRAVTSFLLRFLSPTRGTEGVVKTIEKAWLEVELPLAKGRRRDSKDSFFNGKEPNIQGNTSGKRNKQLYHSFNY